jgi:hypothetical protein
VLIYGTFGVIILISCLPGVELFTGMVGYPREPGRSRGRSVPEKPGLSERHEPARPAV